MTSTPPPVSSAPSPRASTGTSTPADSVSHMKPARVPRDTRLEPVKFGGFVVDKSYRETFERVVKRTGVSGAMFLERLIDHLGDELDERGFPVWWPDKQLKDGELDMPAP